MRGENVLAEWVPGGNMGVWKTNGPDGELWLGRAELGVGVRIRRVGGGPIEGGSAWRGANLLLPRPPARAI